jgi:oligoribonuclease NrnB/cAMP/cGMP phosphodiesterase (DHH superfamily)
MDEALIDSDGLSLARKSVLPGAGFFYPDSLDEERDERRAIEALSGATTVVIADPDADGLACTALLRAAYGRPGEELADDVVDRIRERLDGDDDANDDAGSGSEGEDPGIDPTEVVAAESPDAGAIGEDDGDEPSIRERSAVGLVPTGPSEIAEALALVAEHADPGVDVFVCDLCPDEFESVDAELAAVLDFADSVRWFDHHQWDPDVADAVREAGVDLVVGDSDEECTADVVVRSVAFDFPEYLVELAAVTRDHDLWIREDERSDDLADLAYWLDPETYAETVRAHGADLPGVAREYLAHRREEKEALIERAVERADTRSIGPWTVAVTYGRCSQNEVAEALRQRGADAAVVVKPAGSASIRGSDSFERCHEVARQVDGGGHPKAAGCKPDVHDDMLDYAHHWSTRGAVTKQVILEAFRALDTGDEAADGD